MSISTHLDMELDSLLDEVESRYIFHSPSNSPLPHVQTSIRDEIDIEVETLLEDIKKIERSPASCPKKLISISEQTSLQRPSGRCDHLYLSGANKKMGKSLSSCIKACDNIRCISCDFVILSFDNRKWTDRADYLFFRNHMPDKQKLLTHTKVSRGCRAYACQCTWVSVQDLLEVAEDQSLKSKWVCWKHF